MPQLQLVVAQKYSSGSSGRNAAEKSFIGFILNGIVILNGSYCIRLVYNVSSNTTFSSHLLCPHFPGIWN